MGAQENISRYMSSTAIISVQFIASDTKTPDEQLLVRWAELTLLRAGHQSAGEIVIRITDEKESASLNRRWRNKLHPTNVLSFPAKCTGMPIPILGDIVICAPIVQKEAQKQRKSVTAHWAHMVVHGVLHLLGYDHIKAHDMQAMEALEVSLLNELDFPNPYIKTH